MLSFKETFAGKSLQDAKKFQEENNKTTAKALQAPEDHPGMAGNEGEADPVS